MAAGKKRLLKHGFKAKAERISLDYRDKLSLAPESPLCAFELAKFLNIQVFADVDFKLTQQEIEKISGSTTRKSGWSALVMPNQAGNTIIIHNTAHSPARQQSNLMHELAHIICEHKTPQRQIELNLPFYMRDYSPIDEAEANQLGASLQLPRTCLVWALKEGMTNTQIAAYYNASEEMVRFRISGTGVKKQLSYLKH